MSVSISGILLDPYGQPARFAEVKFIAWQGANDVLTTASSVFKASEDGAYSFAVEFGTFTVQVRYDRSNGKFQTISQKTIVNSTTVASTLGELLLFNEPLTPPEIAYVEQLVAEADGYRDQAAVSAAASELSAQNSLTYSQNSQSSANDSEQSATDAANSAAAIVGVPLNGGVWAAGQTFTAYNQYMIYNGTPYAPLAATPLPYGPVGATPDFAFVGPYPLNDHSKLLNRNDVGSHDASAISLELPNNDLLNESARVVFEKSVTVRIPTDYPNLQLAFNALSGCSASNDHNIIVNIESGHALSGAGLGIYSGDYSSFIITSDDTIVQLDPSFTGVPFIQPDYIPGEVTASYPNSLFYFYNCKAPQIGCKFDMKNNHGEGLFYIQSEGFIFENCGVINAGRRGVNARNSRVWAAESDFRGANSSGARAQLASSLDIGSANLDDCCKTHEQSNGTIYASRASNVEARFATVRNSGGAGIVARRSKVSAANVNATNCQLVSFRAESCAEIDAATSICGSGADIIYQAEFGGKISAAGSIVTAPSNVNRVFRIRSGGEIILNDTATVDGSPVSRANVFLETGSPRFEFNVPTGFGVVYNENAPASLNPTTVGIWNVNYLPNNRFTAWTSAVQFIDIGTVASNSFSNAFTLPAKDASFTTVESYSVEMDGRTSAGGGGNRVFVNHCVGNNYESTETRVQNLGQRLDGANTGLPIESVGVRVTLHGEWV